MVRRRRKIPKKSTASAATGTRVEMKPEREFEVLVWVPDPAVFVFVDWKMKVS